MVIAYPALPMRPITTVPWRPRRLKESAESSTARHARVLRAAGKLLAMHLGRRAHDRVNSQLTSAAALLSADCRSVLSRAAAEGALDHWLIAQTAERVVAYGQVTSWREAAGTWVYLVLGWVRPEWRRQGIGTALLHWSEKHSRRLAAEQHPREKAEVSPHKKSYLAAP